MADKSLGAIVAAGIVGVIAWAFSKEVQKRETRQQVVLRREPDRTNIGGALVDVLFSALDDAPWGQQATPGTAWTPDASQHRSGGSAPVSGRRSTSQPSPAPQTRSSGGLNALLDLIGSVEAPKGYDQVWGGIRANDRPPRPLTSMTVQEVLNWQNSIDSRYNSEAAGRYQFMEDTLRDLVREGHARPDETFDKRTQDRLAVTLMERRGLRDYQSGRIGKEKFAQNLSKEWASLPAITRDRRGRVATGQSYYAGDGLNRSHVSQNRILEAVGNI